MEIISGIHWIKGVNGNCFLLVNSEITLIDTGLPHQSQKIISYITNTLHRSLSDVKMIILTHHLDHIGNAQILREQTGAIIAAYGGDVDYITGRKIPPTPKGGMRIAFVLFSPMMKVKPFSVDRILNNNDQIAGLTVIHVPGHTPGSIALYDPKNKALFSGDTLRYMNGIVEGPSEKFSVDKEKARQSVELLKALDFNILCGGHGIPLTSMASTKVRQDTAPRP